MKDGLENVRDVKILKDSQGNVKNVIERWSSKWKKCSWKII